MATAGRRSDALRIGLAGAGMISRYHLMAWQKVTGVRVVAIADPDMARAGARADEFGIEACYPDLATMLDQMAIDVLDIASPRETHAALILAAAGRGIDVLCQKPLAPTLAEAERVVAAVGGRVRLMVHENWRFRSYYRQIARWIAQGVFGKLRSASVTVHGSGLLPNEAGVLPALERQPFFATERRLLIQESLIHHIDTARFLFGPLRLRHAYTAPNSPAVLGETQANLLLDDETGAPVRIDGNLTCHGYPPANRDRCEFIGSEASIILKDDRLHLLGARPETIAYDHATVYQGSFDAVMQHFVECLRTNAPFETGPEDNLETLRIVEDAYAFSKAN